jgi:2-polyprenyl-3-methyl-5-hydroxy-6-metoxy-1,4-benzoquinol methylase
MLDTDDAIRALRADPRYATLIEDSYLTPDVAASARRFCVSDEFLSVLDLVGGVAGKRVLDVGSGNGIAAFSFASEGATVLALEPNLSSDFGAGAIRKVTASLSVQAVAGTGESIPLRDHSIDIVYGRQVLHHARELRAFVGECSRVLRHDGVFIATREHVVDDAAQLRQFLAKHAVHQLAGGEHAYSLATYVEAIVAAGFAAPQVIGPWDSVINAFPTARTRPQLDQLPRVLLTRFFGTGGRLVSAVPGVTQIIWKLLRRNRPGRMYAFVARPRCGEWRTPGGLMRRLL